MLIAWIPYLIPQLYVFTHRGVTHSIFIGFLVSTASFYLFTHKSTIARLNYRFKLSLNTNGGFNRQSILIAYLGALSHIMLDYSTTYGIPVFYPFSINKYSGELFFYMDFIIMISGIALILALYKGRIKNPTPFLAAFLLLILAMGGFRLVEKYDAASAASSPSSLYPTANPFVWWVIVEERSSNSIYVSRYDNLLKNYEFSTAYPEYDVISTPANFSFEEALTSAKALPQVERFYWNSPKVSITAIYNNTSDSWFLQIKDPLREAMIKSSSGFSGLSLSARSGLNVSVSKHEAKVLN